MIGRIGDCDFSFAHNLLKSWLYQASNVLTPLLHDFQPLQGARWLTILFSGLTAFLLSLSVRSITRSFTAAMIAPIVWFAIPGNLSLISSLEDNTWGNAFNAGFLFLTLKLAGYSRPRMDKSANLVLLSAVTGVVLSAGVNVHQQVVVDFYAFFILMFLSYERHWRLILYMIAFFVAGYIGGSLLQNYLAFGQPELCGSIRRLYHDEYKGCFPALYFFTSGQSVGEWSSRIILGWKRTFLFDARYVPFWGPICLVAISGILGVVAESCRRGTFFFLYRGRLLAFLAVATLIHIPHSLVYEPENIERWDSALPSFVIIGILTTHFAIEHLSRYRTLAKTIAVVSVTAVLISLCQAWRNYSKGISAYERDSAVVGLRHVIGYLTNQSETSERHVVLLDSLYDRNDIQTRLTYHFPHITVVTFNSELKLIYSSTDLQNRGPLNSLCLAEIVFPTNSHFSVTVALLADLKTKAPEFISSHDVHIIPAGEHDKGDRD
jgi:hypothetical protein